jgi:hypothetical protein
VPDGVVNVVPSRAAGLSASLGAIMMRALLLLRRGEAR